MGKSLGLLDSLGSYIYILASWIWDFSHSWATLIFWRPDPDIRPVASSTKQAVSIDRLPRCTLSSGQDVEVEQQNNNNNNNNNNDNDNNNIIPKDINSKTWICLRCLEKVETILPNGGLMFISYGRELKITLNKSSKNSHHQLPQQYVPK